jgi:Na+/H+ antiporter NhaD/arsenite permease-like protein
MPVAMLPVDCRPPGAAKRASSPASSFHASRIDRVGSQMTMDAWVAAAVFVVVYGLIAFDRWDRTLIAMAGGLLVVLLGIIGQEEAFAAVDLNVIFLLVGMMVIAAVLAKTGFFDWLAIRSVMLSHGHPIRLLLILSIVTAVVSAFIDNVTTVVLMTPIILSVAKRLDISPVPYLIAVIFASNIGGTATLIGDPPNILIGSAAGLGFDDFLFNLAPVVILVFLAFAVIMWLVFRRHLKVPDERREAALERTEENTIKDRPLMIRALLVTAGTIVGFLFHSALGVEPATIAMAGAVVLMLVGGLNVHKTLQDIEWGTLFFFVGLFILVESLIATGIVQGIAEQLAEITRGDPVIATLGLMWFSAGASAIIDNIPYTATAIPIVQYLAATGIPAEPLWWALALGACLGGNLTIVGASANVVVANVSDRAGYPIRFGQFFKYGSAVVLASMVVCTAYMWVRYLS